MENQTFPRTAGSCHATQAQGTPTRQAPRTNRHDRPHARNEQDLQHRNRFLVHPRQDRRRDRKGKRHECSKAGKQIGEQVGDVEQGAGDSHGRTGARRRVPWNGSARPSLRDAPPSHHGQPADHAVRSTVRWSPARCASTIREDRAAESSATYAGSSSAAHSKRDALPGRHECPLLVRAVQRCGIQARISGR